MYLFIIHLFINLINYYENVSSIYLITVLKSTDLRKKNFFLETSKIYYPSREQIRTLIFLFKHPNLSKYPQYPTNYEYNPIPFPSCS